MNFGFGDIEIYIPHGIISILSFILAFIVTYVVIPSIVTVSTEKRLFDKPDERKSHSTSIPTLGGAAVFLGMVLPTVLFGDLLFEHEYKYILTGILILFFIGIKDDILVISPRKKLIGEIFAIGIIVVLGNIRVTNFHGFFGIEDIPYVISVMASIFIFVVIINGFNLIDGVDGLASGVGILTISILGSWFVIKGDYPYAAFSFSCVGALIAFFRYNVFSRKNKIFLGDTGSLIIGLVATIFTIKFLEGSLNGTTGTLEGAATGFTVGLLIVPLIDVLRVFFIRIINGKSPFKPDRNHLHHKLLDLGFTHIKTTSIILGFNVVIILISFLFRQLGGMKLLMVTIPISVVLTSIPGTILRYRERMVLKQLELFGNKTWLLPFTLTKSLLARQARIGRVHRPMISGRASLISTTPNGNQKHKDLEPISPYTFLRFNGDDTGSEAVEVEVGK